MRWPPSSRSSTVAEAVVPLGGGAVLRVALPEGAREVAEASLPVVDVSAAPGASLIARRGWSSADDALALRVACANAPSGRWAPGAEELVLGRATAMAQGLVAPDVTSWQPGPIRVAGPGFDQRVDGRSPSDRVALRHLLGFVGEARDVTLCTLACREPWSDSRCVELIEGGAAEAFVAPPPPSLGVRAVFLAAERPHEAAGLAAALALAAVSWILWRRPRPRR